MEAERLQEPVRMLRKGLKNLPGNPAPEQVHKLRTGAREIEAVAAALPGDDKMTRLLLKAIKPVRRAAGDVRDLDVLTTNALKLVGETEPDSMTRLLRSLKTLRQKNASELLKVVQRTRKTARRRLKRFEAQLQEDLAEGESGAEAMRLEGSIGKIMNQLTDELSRWPALSEGNIHRFRLKVKEMRLLLRLERSANLSFLRSLNSAKRKIGDWHDWQRLRETAGEILDPRTDRAILENIDKAVERKLAQALAVSNALRRKFLKLGKARKNAA